MKKNFLNWMLMAAVMLGLGMTVTACSDNDDENVNEELKAQDPYEKQGDVASALYRVVSALAEVDSLPDNWKTATFEPTKGKVLDASKPLVRSLPVANLAEAVSMFRTLTGQNIPDNATSSQWSKDGVGSLSFNATNSSNETAVIDVNLKQMPKLTQLRLVPASAMGENGSFTGDPYYHIGDVLKDGDGRYWICVRSAYSPAGKEDTHWVSMQLITADSKNTKFKSNVRLIKAKAGKYGQHKIQQQLGNGEETKHLKYFAQLMYILNKPEAYANNYAKGGILEDGLGDLGVQAHSNNYVKNLAKYWKDKDIWRLVAPGLVGTNRTITYNPNFNKEDFTTAFTMLYYGHDFSWGGMGSDCTIYTCEQSGTCLSNQSLGEKTWTYNATADTKYDCTDFPLWGQSQSSTTNAGYTGKALVIVQATGKLLNKNSNPGPTKAITACTEILVGKNQDFNKEAEVGEDKSVKVANGTILASNGKYYQKYADIPSSYLPVALVAFHSTGVGTGKLDDTRKMANTLAFALRPMSGTEEWANSSSLAACTSLVSSEGDLWDKVNGLALTKTLASPSCNTNHKHSVAWSCYNYWENEYDGQNFLENTQLKEVQWFLPSAGQWRLMLTGLNIWDASNPAQAFKNLWERIGLTSKSGSYPLPAGSYWTSTEASNNQAWSIIIDTDKVRAIKAEKTEKLKAIPVIAFTEN